VHNGPGLLIILVITIVIAGCHDSGNHSPHDGLATGNGSDQSTDSSAGSDGDAGSDDGEPAPDDPARSVTIQRDPFRLCFDDVVCTASTPNNPVPTGYRYSERARPRINRGTHDAFPVFGWVVGSTRNKVFNRFIWQGNRRAGRDRGTLYEVTSVASMQALDDRMVVRLNTNYAADPTPATLTLRTLDSGATQMHLAPPPGMREAGIAVSLFTLDSPPDEGLFGMGARKDFFNQRGKLRNVWTEQQNTGLGGLADLDLAGLGLPIGLPTSDVLDRLGINPDLDDLLLTQQRSSFPNGAQAAYWVEAYLVGSRGWAAWTTQTHFQRLDLAATRHDKIRWQIVDSDDIDLVVAGGGIETASRAYTDYWGRAPAPPTSMFEPWIDTLNEGEGEAAPNGQGFFGGERARCDVLDFVAKSEQYDIPFGVIGIEGWQVVPRGHPDVQARSNDTICATVANDADSYAADDAHFTPGTDTAGDDFFDYLRGDKDFHIAGYWNFFHSDPMCADPANQAASCVDSVDVPKASKLAFYEAKNNDYFIDNIDTGADQQVTTNRGGVSNIIDFTNPDVFDYWQSQLARMFDSGIDLFMHDFGELTTYDMAFARGENATESHNLYAYEYQHAARKAVDDYMEGRKTDRPEDFTPYFYARAGMTGACAFTPSVFPGDESTTWDKGHGLPSVIPAMLNLALSGCYLFTTDIGGYFDFFAPRTREDLFIRWSQLAALTPVMRIHNSTFNGSVYPWTWVEGDHEDPPRYDTVDIFRRYARLKMNLIPLVEDWTQRAASEGTIGPIRPIILEDQSTAAMDVDYEWLLGHDILVAPVVEDDATEQTVYFPAGAAWKRVHVDEQGRFTATNETHTGGTRESVALSQDLVDIPIFVRCESHNPLVPIDKTATSCQ